MFVYRAINSEFNRIGQSKEYRMDKTTRGSSRFTVFLFKFGLGKQHSKEMDCMSGRKEHRGFPKY